MHQIIDNSYRFIRSAEYQEKMVRLRELKIFAEYSTIMMASAIVGFKNGAYEPIKNRAADGVQLTFFSPDDLDVIDLIAYAHKKDQKILRDIEKYHIFESYANGGFPILYEKLGIDEETTIDKREEILIRYYTLVKGKNGFKL